MMGNGLFPNCQYRKSTLAQLLSENISSGASVYAIPSEAKQCGKDCIIKGDLRDIPKEYEKLYGTDCLVEFLFNGNGINLEVLQALKEASEKNEEISFEGIYFPRHKDKARGSLFEVEKVYCTANSYSKNWLNRLEPKGKCKDLSLHELVEEGQVSYAKVSAVPRGSALCDESNLIKGYLHEPGKARSVKDALNEAKARVKFNCYANGSSHELIRFLNAASEGRIPVNVKGEFLPEYVHPAGPHMKIDRVSYGEIEFD
jgi:hypothetical protein